MSIWNPELQDWFHDRNAHGNSINNLLSLVINKAGGWLKMEGDGRVWKDLNLGGVNLTKAASNQPNLVSIGTTDVKAYAFEGGGATEELHGGFELQHDYAEGTDLKPHLHWYPATAGGGSTNAKWFLEYWISVEGTTVESGTTSVVSSVPTTAWEQVFVDFDSVISGTNLLIASQIHFRLYRDSGDVDDDYTGDAVLSTVGIHYELSSIGSRQTAIK